jgi:hypothetical protein
LEIGVSRRVLDDCLLSSLILLTIGIPNAGVGSIARLAMDDFLVSCLTILEVFLYG